MRLRLVLAVLILATPAGAQEIRTDIYYRLSAELRGTGVPLGAVQCLDVFGEGPDKDRLYLNECGFWAGQLWTLKPTDQPLR